MNKQYYALYLRPPRPTFAQDMNEQERAIMMQHVTYWSKLMEQGKVVAYGPVMDPQGAYGLGIVGVENEDELKELIGNDPANGLNRYEHFSMRAIVKP